MKNNKRTVDKIIKIKLNFITILKSNTRNKNPTNVTTAKNANTTLKRKVELMMHGGYDHHGDLEESFDTRVSFADL